MRNKDKLALGKVLMYGSVICIMIAFVGAMGNDLWLASTQWMLIGLTLAVWSVFVLIEAQFKIQK